MRGAAMSLTAAVSGFIVLLLSVSVVQGQGSWRVTYSSLQICAYKGSTVEMNCTFTYPERTNGEVNSLQKTFWLRKDGYYYKDVETDSEYSGRVQNICEGNKCTLRITNLRETDSTEYRFRFITNKDSYSGRPGVTLSVTDLQVKVSRPHEALLFECLSGLSSQTSYIWFRNGHQIKHQTSYYYYPPEQLLQTDSYSCALSGHEKCPSPPVYAPKLLSVSVIPAGEIKKNSSVTLTCSSDANPAATFKWYKRNQTPKYRREGAQLVFNYIRPSASGEYYCEAENKLGRKRSGYVSINVKYAPSVCSASVSPAGEIRENSRVTVTCSCDANPAPEYTWYKKYGRELSKESELVFSSVQSSDSGWYYCAAKNDLGESSSGYVKVEVKYAPKLPSVSVSPSAEIVEGSSVTLSCSSDANPAANYTWYKKKSYWDQTLIKNKHLVFSSVQSSDSGEFYCTAVNTVGSQKSKSISIDVKYSPKLPSVSLSPSAEIVEGSSVTLTCSSDANPEPEYTWYKKNNNQPLSKEAQLVFSSIKSSDSGEFYCKAENDLGEKTSTWISIDVKYSPKLPSVSVSPSAEIVEGSSVTLTCSSDANPAANYTWYKEDEDSPTASGQIFTINDTSRQHSGHYICIAQNTRGRHNSTVHLSVLAAGGWKLTTAVTVSAIFLIIILIFVVIWIIKKKACKQPSEPGDRPENSEQIQPAEEQDELQYATVDFSRNQADPLYSNIQPVKPQRHKKKKKEEEEGGQEEMVDYSMVNFNSGGAAQSTSGQQAADPAALYSTVNKHGRRNL